jgi:4-methylaminobutanoate oxidase (formaldehyde-forming)
MGPRADAILSRVSRHAFDPAVAIGTRRFAEIDIGYARVRAARMSYVGGPGYELYVPVEFAVHVYETLHEAGAKEGLADAGYYAIDAMRVEAGRRAWSAELSPDETPIHAGLMHAVAMDKSDFIGRGALLQLRQDGVRKRLVMLALDDPHAWVWGGEGILRDGEPVGEVTSAGWSATLGRVVVMGYAHANRSIDRAWVLAGSYVVDIAGERVTAKVLERPAFRG